ncbi:amidohydrolase family protein [Paenibacillus humicola]|uniref:amidohydrolase family protein n=1 Tax=Paenibacillus humicola TaxID=3110540 RepID=UPI00237BF19B|nr:amidohydrolase family protein [Paenibacillus humicola]
MDTVIDAYAHIGLPRYGGVGDFTAHMERFSIRKSVMALFNAVPDFASLFSAIRDNPETIRGVGIPFGKTDEQRMELVRLQLQAGVIGIRMEPWEALGNPAVLQLLGENGRWVYGLSPFQSDELSRLYLDWLDRYPQGRVASPHLLYTDAQSQTVRQSQAARELLAHPRFYVIFSRHGGLGSREAYPHRDFLPWLSFVFERAETDRIMWGSEYPVVYSRNESMPTCIAWLEEIGAGLSDEAIRKIMRDNADRALFGHPLAPADPQALDRVPGWVEEQFDRSQTVRLYNREGFELPLDVYGKLLNGYLQSGQWREGIPFADYAVRRIAEAL